jgi:hypothetical protein
MSFKATKIGGTSMLTMLGVLCLGTFLIAAFTWSSYSTDAKNPQEVSLSAPSVDEWSDADFFEAKEDYNVTMTATYNYHGEESITYKVKVVATVSAGTIEASDFAVTLTGDVSGTFTQSPEGTWLSSGVTVLSGNANDVLTVKIVPASGALDLSGVTFTISAVSV